MWMGAIPGGLGSWRMIENLIHDGYRCAGSPATMILQTQTDNDYLDLSGANPRRQDIFVAPDIIVRDINHLSLICTSQNIPIPPARPGFRPSGPNASSNLTVLLSTAAPSIGSCSTGPVKNTSQGFYRTHLEAKSSLHCCCHDAVLDVGTRCVFSSV